MQLSAPLVCLGVHCSVIQDVQYTSSIYVQFHCAVFGFGYRKTSNIKRTLVGNKIVDHSGVVGASPVGAAPTTSSFST